MTEMSWENDEFFDRDNLPKVGQADDRRAFGKTCASRSVAGTLSGRRPSYLLSLGRGLARSVATILRVLGHDR